MSPRCWRAVADALAASAVDSGAARLVGAARFDACCLLGRRAQPCEEASGGGGGRRGVAAGAEGPHACWRRRRLGLGSSARWS